jgi:hypothetical protein
VWAVKERGGGKRGKQRNQSKNDGILREVKDIDMGDDFATNVPAVKNFDRRPLNHSLALQHPSKTSIDDRLTALTTPIESSNTKPPPVERYAGRSFPRFFDDSPCLPVCIVSPLSAKSMPVDIPHSLSSDNFFPGKQGAIAEESGKAPAFVLHRSPISALINHAPIPPAGLNGSSFPPVSAAASSRPQKVNSSFS